MLNILLNSKLSLLLCFLLFAKCRSYEDGWGDFDLGDFMDDDFDLGDFMGGNEGSDSILGNFGDDIFGDEDWTNLSIFEDDDFASLFDDNHDDVHHSHDDDDHNDFDNVEDEDDNFDDHEDDEDHFDEDHEDEDDHHDDHFEDDHHDDEDNHFEDHDEDEDNHEDEEEDEEDGGEDGGEDNHFEDHDENEEEEEEEEDEEDGGEDGGEDDHFEDHDDNEEDHDEEEDHEDDNGDEGDHDGDEIEEDDHFEDHDENEDEDDHEDDHDDDDNDEDFDETSVDFDNFFETIQTLFPDQEDQENIFDAAGLLENFRKFKPRVLPTRRPNLFNFGGYFGGNRRINRVTCRNTGLCWFPNCASRYAMENCKKYCGLCNQDEEEEKPREEKPREGWSEWKKGRCSVTCGFGVIRDQRSCHGNELKCAGADVRNVDCEMPECKDCKDLITECDRIPCDSNVPVIMKAVKQKCRKHCGLCGKSSEAEKETATINQVSDTGKGWSKWKGTKCSVDCGKGNRILWRKCLDETDDKCVGPAAKMVDCTGDKCDAVKWSEWASSECSVSCGRGEMTQTRSCRGCHDDKEKLVTKETRVVTCQKPACPRSLFSFFG